MPQSDVHAPGRTIITRGFTRLRLGLITTVAAIVAAVIVTLSLNLGHGSYALVVLLVAAVAMTFLGGPERRARTITITPSQIHITRFHTVASTIGRGELRTAEPHTESGSGGRSLTTLLLEPNDPVEFFTRHPELRQVRRGDTAAIPAGDSARTATELHAALLETKEEPR